MAHQDEVRQYRHGDSAVVALDDGAGVKLSASAGAQKLHLPAVRHDQSFEAVASDVLNDALCCHSHCDHFRILFVPDVQSFRRGHCGKSGEVSFDTDAFDLLNAALEVPVAVCVSQDASSFGVALAALGLEKQELLDRDVNQSEVRRRVLYQTDDVVVVVVQPFVERLLRSDGELLPADETVCVLTAKARVFPLAAASLVDDFVGAPAVGQE